MGLFISVILGILIALYVKYQPKLDTSRFGLILWYNGKLRRKHIRLL